MSANLDFVRLIFADWERGDFSAAEWAAEDIEFVRADGPEPGSWRGRAGMAQGWRNSLSAWRDLRSEAEQLNELDGERVLALARATARGKTSGVELETAWTRHAALFHIRDGTVVRLVVYVDRERALADLGLEA